MKYLSTFSGIGGFELGIQQAYESNNTGEQEQDGASRGRHSFSDGIESDNKLNVLQTSPTCIGFSEIDKYAIQIYQSHFPNHKNYGDITTINTDELPDFDLLVGGFPCQSFSIAGKRRGFEDTRGTMFFELARILRAKQPRLFVFENVKGLLSHDNGNTFKTIISAIDELGYDCQWQVLNSKNHGVPQNRERVFIVGHLRGTSRPEVFPFTTANGKDIEQINKPRHSNDRVYGTDGISPTLNTMQGGNRQPFIKAVLTPDRSEKRQNGRRIKEDGEPSFTLTAQDRHGIYDGMKIRRLTPTECERLQGFPEVEKSSIIEICLDLQKNSVNVETQSLKLQRHASNVEKKESNEVVLSADQSSASNSQLIDKPVQADVVINCGEKGVQIHSQGKCLLNATGVEKQNWCHPLISLEDFVHLVVGLNTIAERITLFGKGESHQKEQSSTLQRNGSKLVRLYGSEITQHANDVAIGSTILKELSRYTTSNPLELERVEQFLKTLSSYVTRVITGFIPNEIQSQNTWTIQINSKVGWTEGVSDTQRYKTLGNAVTVNVIRDIMERLLQD
jgi:DNA (cytosine-5)-methyltransferase 1